MKKITLFITYQDSIQNFKQSVYLAKNNMDKEPVRSSKSKTKTKGIPDATVGKDGAITYIVKSGDNLGAIASKYKVTINSIKDWNGLNSNNLSIGQSLTVFGPKAITEAPRDTNAVVMAANQPKVEKENSKGQLVEQSSTVAASGPSEQFILYTVRSGDNLWTIAQKYPGTSHEDIMKLNQMTGSKLQTGQVLKIKRKEG